MTSPVSIITAFWIQQAGSVSYRMIAFDRVWWNLNPTPCFDVFPIFLLVPCKMWCFQVNYILISVFFVHRVHRSREYRLSFAQILVLSESILNLWWSVNWLHIRCDECSRRNCPELVRCPAIQDQWDCVLNDLEELGDKEFLVLMDRYNIEIFSWFLRLLPCCSSTFRQTNVEIAQNGSEDHILIFAPSSSRGRLPWRWRVLSCFDSEQSEIEYSPGSTSVQVLSPIRRVLVDELAEIRLRGFLALAFDRLAKEIHSFSTLHLPTASQRFVFLDGKSRCHVDQRKSQSARSARARARCWGKVCRTSPHPPHPAVTSILFSEQFLCRPDTPCFDVSSTLSAGTVQDAVLSDRLKEYCLTVAQILSSQYQSWIRDECKLIAHPM